MMDDTSLFDGTYVVVMFNVKSQTSPHYPILQFWGSGDSKQCSVSFGPIAAARWCSCSSKSEICQPFCNLAMYQNLLVHHFSFDSLHVTCEWMFTFLPVIIYHCWIRPHGTMVACSSNWGNCPKNSSPLWKWPTLDVFFAGAPGSHDEGPSRGLHNSRAGQHCPANKTATKIDKICSPNAPKSTKSHSKAAIHAKH